MTAQTQFPQISTTRDVPVGALVISRPYSGTYRYEGPDTDRGHGMTSLNVGIGSGGPAGLSCDPDLVAPASEVVVDVKDPRIVVEPVTVEQRKAYRAQGLLVWGDSKWQSMSPTGNVQFFKTKKDAIAYAARVLAILDWHAAGE